MPAEALSFPSPPSLCLTILWRFPMKGITANSTPLYCPLRLYQINYSCTRLSTEEVAHLLLLLARQGQHTGSPETQLLCTPLNIASRFRASPFQQLRHTSTEPRSTNHPAQSADHSVDFLHAANTRLEPLDYSQGAALRVTLQTSDSNQ